MQRRSGHRFNMCVMRRDYFDAWRAWLFPVLFKIEARMDTGSYDAYNARVFGFLSERLMDVWINTLIVVNTRGQEPQLLPSV